MSTAKIFEYKGHIGVIIDMDNGKFINNPKDGLQLGCVISTQEIEITKEAVVVIKRANRSGGSFAELQLTIHRGPAIKAHGKSSIGIMGFGKVSFAPGFEIGRECDTSALDDCSVAEIEVPQDYKNFIDSQ